MPYALSLAYPFHSSTHGITTSGGNALGRQDNEIRNTIAAVTQTFSFQPPNASLPNHISLAVPSRHVCRRCFGTF